MAHVTATKQAHASAVRAERKLIERYHVDERLAEASKAIDPAGGHQRFQRWRAALDRSDTAMRGICKQLDRLVYGTGDERLPGAEHRPQPDNERARIVNGHLAYFTRDYLDLTAGYFVNNAHPSSVTRGRAVGDSHWQRRHRRRLQVRRRCAIQTLWSTLDRIRRVAMPASSQPEPRSPTFLRRCASTPRASSARSGELIEIWDQAAFQTPAPGPALPGGPPVARPDSRPRRVRQDRRRRTMRRRRSQTIAAAEGSARSTRNQVDAIGRLLGAGGSSGLVHERALVVDRHAAFAPPTRWSSRRRYTRAAQTAWYTWSTGDPTARATCWSWSHLSSTAHPTLVNGCIEYT